jgi:hypothetical protein
MVDEYGYPGIEDFTLEEFTDMKAFVQVAFKAFGYSWQHERIVAYLQRVQKIVKRPVRNCHELPYKHYRMLAMLLAAEVVQLQEDRRAAADSAALLMATAMLRTTQKQLVEAR